MKKKVNFRNITIESLAGLISSQLKKYSIDSVLVGGACVSVYSKNRYESYDLDYVTYEDIKDVKQALMELKFEQKGKYFIRSDCKYFIDFVAPPVALGADPVVEFEYHDTLLGTIKMLTPTDSIKDRLLSYYHWDEDQALEQAIAIYKQIPKRIELLHLKKWSIKENQLQKYNEFIKKINLK